MELHSYAKRRPLKKWTIEQKRKLVETRITYDNWFTNKPTNSVAPWKKILAIAQLDDFNVFFVRKQWSNMIAKYRQFKQNRLGDTNTKLIDNDMICRLTQDWEFFEPIHKFMVRKTANLHSYALTEKGEDAAVDEAEGEAAEGEGDGEGDADAAGNTVEGPTDDNDVINNSKSDSETSGKRRKSYHSEDDEFPASTSKANLLMNLTEKDISNNIGMLVCASNERIHELGSEMRDKKIYRIYNRVETTNLDNRSLTNINTDHDSYSKPICGKCKMYKCQCSKNGVGIAVTLLCPLPIVPFKKEDALSDLPSSPLQANVNDSNQQQEQREDEEGEEEEQQQTNESPHLLVLPTPPTQHRIQGHEMKYITKQDTSTPVASRSNVLSSEEQSSTVLTEREKYYRHKRNFYQRLDKRIDSVLQVVGEIIKTEYPNVDVSKLMDSNYSRESNFNSNDSISEYTTGSDDSRGSNAGNI